MWLHQWRMQSWRCFLNNCRTADEMGTLWNSLKCGGQLTPQAEKGSMPACLQHAVWHCVLRIACLGPQASEWMLHGGNCCTGRGLCSGQGNAWASQEAALQHTQTCMAAALGPIVHNSTAYGVEAGLH